MTSPTQRSLKKLRDEGYTCAIVEHFNSFVRVRQDLFNFIDIVAIKEGIVGVLGIQTTTRAHVNERLKKIHDNPISQLWLNTKNHIIIHGWSKIGARGKRKLWNCYEVIL